MPLDQITTFEQLKKKVADFRDERDWKQFHNPKDLATAISIEAGELQELMLWVKEKDLDATCGLKLGRIQEEMADVLIYLLSMANVLDIDLSFAVNSKLAKNAEKYSVEKSKGNALKYTEL